MAQTTKAIAGRDDSNVQLKQTPAEIIRKGVEAEPMTDIIIPFLKDQGFGGKDGDLNSRDKAIAFAVVAKCKEEVVRVVQDNNGKIIALFEAAADRQAKVTVGMAGAMGMGLGNVVSGIGNFLTEDFVPRRSTPKSDSSGAEAPPTAATLWARFNKRGWFVFLTLVVTAVVAVGVTRATQSWESAARAAREARDSLAETNARLTSELDKAREDKAKADGELKNIREQLDVATANAATYRDRYNELAGRTAVAPDVKDIQARFCLTDHPVPGS